MNDKFGPRTQPFITSILRQKIVLALLMFYETRKILILLSKC